MNPILAFLTAHKFARYGVFTVAGIIIGLWLGNQYPTENAKLWALPAVSLAMALAGVVAGQAATKGWLAKVDEALMTPPPGATIIEAVKGEVVPK